MNTNYISIPICVESVISDLDDENSVIETKVFADAKIEHKHGKVYIVYEEYDLKNDVTEVRQLSYDPKNASVSVITTGGSKLYLKEGYLHNSDYITQAGSFDMKVRGKTVMWDEQNMHLDLEYDTVLSGSLRSNVKIKLRKCPNLGSPNEKVQEN